MPAMNSCFSVECHGLPYMDYLLERNFVLGWFCVLDVPSRYGTTVDKSCYATAGEGESRGKSQGDCAETAAHSDQWTTAAD